MPTTKINEDDDLSAELKLWDDASARDVLKSLGPISREEYDYYENLCRKQNKL